MRLHLLQGEPGVDRTRQSCSRGLVPETLVKSSLSVGQDGILSHVDRFTMAELKTKPTEQSVEDFLNSIADEKQRADCLTVAKLMQKATRAKPKMWGESIVGFGQYRYKYQSGREGDWFIVGFSPRKQNLTLYLMAGFARFPELLQKLGKFKTSQSCLYLKKLADVDLKVLKELIEQAVAHTAKQDAQG
jgi:hypothetical protein